MGVKCQIHRNNSGDVVNVVDDRGNDSVLYKELLKKYNSKDALDLWSVTYTKQFKDYLGDLQYIGGEPTLKEVEGFENNYISNNINFTPDEKNIIYDSLATFGLDYSGDVIDKLHTVFVKGDKSITQNDLVSTGLYSTEEVINILSNPELLGGVILNIKRLYNDSLKEDNFISKINFNDDLLVQDTSETNILGKNKRVISLETYQDLIKMSSESDSVDDFISRVEGVADVDFYDTMLNNEDFFNKVKSIYFQKTQSSVLYESNGEIKPTGFKGVSAKESWGVKKVKLYNTEKSPSELFRGYGLIKVGDNDFVQIYKYTSIDELKRSYKKRVEYLKQDKDTSESYLENVISSKSLAYSEEYNELSAEEISKIILWSEIFDLPLGQNNIREDLEGLAFIYSTSQNFNKDSFIQSIKERIKEGNNILSKMFYENDGVVYYSEFALPYLKEKTESILDPLFLNAIKIYGAIEERSNIKYITDYSEFNKEANYDDLLQFYSDRVDLLPLFKGSKEKSNNGYIINSDEMFLNIEGELYTNNGSEFTKGLDNNTYLYQNNTNPVIVENILTKEDLKNIDNEMGNC